MKINVFSSYCHYDKLFHYSIGIITQESKYYEFPVGNITNHDDELTEIVNNSKKQIKIAHE